MLCLSETSAGGFSFLRKGGPRAPSSAHLFRQARESTMHSMNVNEMNRLIQKIGDRKILVGIIGMGYVGLPLVLRFCEQGFKVLGFDVDPKKVVALRKGTSYIKTLPSSRLLPFVKNGQFNATDHFSRLREPECILICVPTPLTEKMEPDLQYIEKTSEAIRKNLKRGQLIVLESTTYPGTTEEAIL